MTTRTVLTALAASLCLAGCSAPQAEKAAQRRPQQAGQPIDPLRTAGHIAGARVSALVGDQQGVRRNMDAMSDDLRRAMKLADANRPIDREAARSVARTIAGVRSANWIDRHNLLVRVEGAALRSQQTIDELCLRLEPLGDTLAVVVHLQDTAPVDRDGMDTLSRNCQLALGDHAMFQRGRQVDALEPGVRATHRATAERMGREAAREQSEGDRKALEAMREM